jgi:hypothetical protein
MISHSRYLVRGVRLEPVQQESYIYGAALWE